MRDGSGFVTPLVFGATLGLVGGHVQPLAWAVAFGALGLGCLNGTIVMREKLQISNKIEHFASLSDTH